jgi:hypothetical protein
MLNEVKHLARVSARLSRPTRDRLQPLIGAVTFNQRVPDSSPGRLTTFQNKSSTVAQGPRLLENVSCNRNP